MCALALQTYTVALQSRRPLHGTAGEALLTDRSSSMQAAPILEIRTPEGETRIVELNCTRLRLGRSTETNDVALLPDPQHLVTRENHCVLELATDGWWLVDTASVNGTFLMRAGSIEQVRGRAHLVHGDVIRVLGRLSETGEPKYWELEFQDQTTVSLSRLALEPCLSYDWPQARLFRREPVARTEIRGLSPQEHKLVRYMARRNLDNDGLAVLCLFEELMSAVWDEPEHTQDELARIVWSLRRKVELQPSEPKLLELERGFGYRLHTCRPAESG
jgi:hypothetical protein